MIKSKFKSFLEAEFRTIAPTKEAMEYREEVLGNLMDKAQEFRIKGMTDEDIIYNLCIDSLGDFRSTLLDFETKRANLAQVAKKASSKILIVAGCLLAVVLCYLLVSFLSGAWNKSWLIMVGGVFGIIITLSVFVIQKLGKAKKYGLIRLPILLINTLTIVFVFLMLLMLTTWKQSWLLFLILPVSLVGIDTIFSFLINSKARFLELFAAVPLLFTMTYVILGIVGLLPWHPTWLMIIFGILVDIAVLVVRILNKSKKKKEIEDAKKAEDPDYYTKWNDR